MKIGMIVPIAPLGETAAEIANSLGIEFCYRKGEVGTALDVAQKLIQEQGAQAIIVRNPLNHILSNSLDVPVLSLDITHLDIIRTVRKIPTEKSVGFLFVTEDEEKYNYGLDEIEAFSGRRVELIPCPLCKQYSQVLSDRDFLVMPQYEKMMECEAFITATPSIYKWGQRLGKQVEYISIDELALKNVMLNAVNAVDVQARASQNAEFVEFALNSTNDGFLILQNDRVVMANRNLCRWMEMDRSMLMNKSSAVLQRKNPFFQMISQVRKGNIVTYKDVNYAVYRRKLVDPLTLDSNWDYELISIINVPNIQ